jgi:hypothetical protein
MSILIFLICLILWAVFWRLLLPWVIGLVGLAAIGGVALWIVMSVNQYANTHDPEKIARIAQDEAKANAREMKLQQELRPLSTEYDDHSPTMAELESRFK